MKTELLFRSYNPEKDEKSVVRIWKECGWMDAEKSKKSRKVFRRWLECGSADVVELNGSAECLVTTHKGTITVVDTELPFRAVSSVTAGRPLRRMGGAGELTARAVARAAEEGDAIAGLGIFDQGYYNKLGFGNFPYIRHIHFDPLTLKVPPLERPPIRLGKKDLSRIIANTEERMSHHGLVKFIDADFTDLIIAEHENCFGLGFEDSEGKLSHHFWAEANGENGPYRVLWMIYRDYEGLMELLSVIRNLGDQVNRFTIREPWGLQFQDLLTRPFRSMDISEGGKFENKIEALSFKQARILNMEKTLTALKIPGGGIRFNLDLSDPISRYLPEDASWKGLAGFWTIEIGENGSSAVPGSLEDLPTMKASINAFTRLVFGVATPSGLAMTDELDAPDELLTELDFRLRLPEPDMVQIF